MRVSLRYLNPAIPKSRSPLPNGARHRGSAWWLLLVTPTRHWLPPPAGIFRCATKMAWNMNICCCTGYSSASFFVTASLLIMRDLPASSSYCRKISCRRNASSIPERIALPRNTMTATI